MKKVRLTTWERLNLVNCLPKESRWDSVDQLLKISEKLDLSDEEKELVGFEVDITGNARWDDTDFRFEINFEDAHYAALVEFASGYNRWPTSVLTSMLRKHFIEEVESYDA